MRRISGKLPDFDRVSTERRITVGRAVVVDSIPQLLGILESQLGNIDDLKLLERLGKEALAAGHTILFEDRPLTDVRFNPYHGDGDPRIHSDDVTPEMRRMTVVADQVTQLVEIMCVLVGELERQ